MHLALHCTSPLAQIGHSILGFPPEVIHEPSPSLHLPPVPVLSQQWSMQGSLLSLSLSLVAVTGQGQDSYRDPYQAGQYQEQQYQPDPYQGSQYQTKGYQEDPYKSQRKQYQAEPYQAEPYQAEPYQAEPYQAITNQEPYRPTNHYQTKKKQYQQEAYQEPYAEEEKAEPKPFAYGYGGVDSQGLQSSKTENQDKDGVVRGEYRVELPDGRTQVSLQGSQSISACMNCLVSDTCKQAKEISQTSEMPLRPKKSLTVFTLLVI